MPGREAAAPDPDAPCACAAATTPANRSHRLSWAQLLARGFRLDLTRCPACGGPMKIVAALSDPHSIRSYLEGVGLPARAPPIAPARPHPQLQFDDAA